MGCAGCLRDFLLGEAELEAALAQVRGNGTDLLQGTDAFVFGARVTVGLAAFSATLGGLDSATSDWVVKSASHKLILSRMVSTLRCRATPVEHRVPPPEAVGEDARPFAPESQPSASQPRGVCEYLSDIQTERMGLSTTPDRLADVGERVVGWYSVEMQG